MSDIIHRSEEDVDSKKTRSDKCKKDCRFRDTAANKCVFETCLLEELPPFQSENCTVNCFICGNPIGTTSMSIVTDYRVCGDCRAKLKIWIDRCYDITTHVDTCPHH